MVRRFLLAVIFVVTLLIPGFSQNPINSYAKVTAVNGTLTTLTISNVNQTYHTFTAGEAVIIVQMQDNVIGTNTGDVATFGDLSAIAFAGRFEVRTISSVNATQMVLTAAISSSFSFGSNSSVQVVSFQDLGTYTTTGNIVALPWDGNIGGVVAIRSSAQFTLAHNISADARGFLGGSSSAGGNGGACQPAIYRAVASNNVGNKGEGIYKVNTASNADYLSARGHLLNGGGGGNNHNGGGGGGGNYTAGGLGGHGYTCETTPVGGLGGVNLNSHYANNRIFMGGGGGGGHQNDNAGSPNGGNGGGLIFFNVYRLATPASCTGPTFRTISSSGGTAGNAANEGAGGGGGGGAILMDVSLFSVTSGCPLTVAANGGSGGTTNNAASHGGGGAGGQGRVIYTVPQPMSNVTTTTANGTAGCNTSACSAADLAGPPGGTSNTGIIDNTGSSPLPVSLIYFTGEHNKESGRYNLQWSTATEDNNDYFTLERSKDAKVFEKIAQVNGSGSSNTAQKYDYDDKTGFDKSYYYRLSQTDFDGTTKMLKLIQVASDVKADPEVWAYPNPVSKSEKLSIELIRARAGINTIILYDMQGAEVRRQIVEVQNSYHTVDIDVSNLAPGLYTISVTSATYGIRRKLVVK